MEEAKREGRSNIPFYFPPSFCLFFPISAFRDARDFWEFFVAAVGGVKSNRGGSVYCYHQCSTYTSWVGPCRVVFSRWSFPCCHWWQLVGRNDYRQESVPAWAPGQLLSVLHCSVSTLEIHTVHRYYPTNILGLAIAKCQRPRQTLNV